MKVVIRRSPPLMTWRGSRDGVLRRALTLGLAFCSIAAVYRFTVLLVAEVSNSTEIVAGSVIDRWHVWLGAALLCAAGASMSWGVGQRPRNRE